MIPGGPRARATAPRSAMPASSPCCASEQDPHAEPVWLALLETVFLARDAMRYVDCARAFHDAHPASESWSEVMRLGRALAPQELLFGPSSGPRDHEHYGPWPHLPN